MAHHDMHWHNVNHDRFGVSQRHAAELYYAWVSPRPIALAYPQV